MKDQDASANEGEPTPIQEINAGESFGQIAWRRFRQKKSAYVGLGLILFITAIGVFAPLLANDRPYYVKAQRPDLYENAFAIIWFDSYNELEKIEEGDATGFSQGHRANLEKQMATARQLLAGDFLSDFVEWENNFIQLGALQSELKPGQIDPLLEHLENAEEQFDSFNPDLEFSPQITWPVFRGLHWGEVMFIVMYPALLVLLLFHRRLGGIRRAIFISTMLGLGAALLWWLAIPARFDSTYYKDLESRGLVESIVYAPIPFGENENILDDAKLPPFWLGAHITESAADNPEIKRNDPRPLWLGDQPGAREYRTHWLGTDKSGRDLGARMVYGSRIAMSIGVVSVAIYSFIGILLGALAGYFGGWADLAVSRFIEVVICFPAFFLILIIISFIGPNIFWIMVVIGLTGWTGMARLTRGEFLRLRSREYVAAVRAAGGSGRRVILRHILPNAIQPAIVSASFGIASAILIESGLSYLGFGVRPPYASWGQLLNEAQIDVRGMWWMTIFPGFAIFATVTAFNLVGEALRDALDPQLTEDS